MEFILMHWEKITGILGLVFSFFAGFKMRKIRHQEAKNLALERRYKADLQKLENYKRAFDINAEMIESIKSDFMARIGSLHQYIEQLEHMNTKLHSIVAKQQQELDKYITKYGKDI
ncbi:hypothetical protein D6T69_14375 [Tenacibaculum singaporense]|uniref:Uncharacterized protein n=3 Tax=Tenacibaculum TaxID=104267 RepID=A0A3Q8RTY2_9FLAO|nr:hypothetical protein [Tenacibaculum singaporense]AZJ34406.1 hypothetical protein D6T69_02220 [Tenacibaculum singaporense]AZJ36654.1 hypothetical protein D6T69_14375 [Tenacibaculum singaporense]